MRLFRNVSIKRKLMLIVMLTSSVALLLSAAGFLAYEMLTFRDTTANDLSSDADLIAAHSAAALLFDRPDEAHKTLRVSLQARPHLTAACLYNGNGIFTNFPPASPQVRPWPAAPEEIGYRFEKDHLVMFRPIKSGGVRIGTIALEKDLTEMNHRLKRYAGIAVLVMIASFLAALFLSSRLQRVISEPVLHLAETAQKVSDEKNYSVRAVKQGNDELGQLIDGFNAMLGQIQQRDADLQKARDQLEIRVEERTQELQQEVAERTRAEEGLQQQLTRISLLNQITYAVAARQDLDSILLVVLQQLEERLPADFGAAYLFDAQTETLNLLMVGPKSRPIADQLPGPKNLPVGQTPFQSCLQGEMVFVPDALEADSVVARQIAEAGLRSMIATPLVVESKVFGLLIIARRNADAFTIAEREFIHGLTAHVALAVRQVQLYLDLQKAYNDLRQTQQAVMQQQRLQALGQMASGIAHDVNNALSPVIAYAELLQQVEPGLTQNAKRILGHIRTAGDDIAHIVARMKEFYRTRDELEQFTPVHLNCLIEEVVELTRPRWRDIPQSHGKALEMQTDLAPNLPVVGGNASELREALTNLILNAVDAMPNGGTIAVRTRAVSLPGRDGKQKQVMVDVTDNGIGMSEETRRRCLEPFFSTKGKRGTGMGLAMVYGIVERHDGAIEIESQVGKGTTMRLIFPAGEPGELAKKEAAEAVVSLPPLRILCIDDEPLLRNLMKEILEADGHHVCAADGGQAGVDAFREALGRKEPFQVVITDLGMPHVNGRQVAQAVKRDSPRTPVIMLTGWGALMKAQSDTPAQVDGVLSKPPRIHDIRKTLKRCVRA